MKKQRNTSYAWARHASLSPNYFELSEAAESGLAYARELTDDAVFRAERALRREQLAPLTPAELAKRDGVSSRSVSGRIARARRELFGDLGDSGIYYRVARVRARVAHPERPCEGPGCRRFLSREATAARRFCTTACRVRAHRQHSRSPLAP